MTRRCHEFIPKSLEQSEIWQGAAMNLSHAKPTPKQLNLNKLSNAGGSQIHWQTTLAKTDSSSDFGISQAKPVQKQLNLNQLGDAAGSQIH